MNSSKLFSRFFIPITCLLFSLNSQSQSVAINNDGSLPNPSAILDVKSVTTGMLIPRMTSAQRDAIAGPAVGLLIFNNETNSFWFRAAGGWTELVTGAANNLWATNGTNVYNTNSGNVGIGTSTPANKLTIQTPINTTGFMHKGGADSIIVSEAIGGVSASFGVLTDHTLRLVAGALGRIQLFSSGNVVLGDNNVQAFGKFTVQTPNNSYGISHTSDQGIVLSTRVGGSSAGIGTFSFTNMRIYSNGVSCMLLSAANGNVGIGTDNPTSKLSVNGSIQAKEVVVETGWADYVFNEKYKLLPLEKVEKYIGQNKHLSGIPSATDIETKGLKIGETEKKMMEKIEELTLYIIQLNKKITRLEYNTSRKHKQ